MNNNLPNIRTTRIKSLSIQGLPKVKIIPWSNQQMITYTQIVEDIKDKELDEDNERLEILNLQYEHLVKPNIVESKVEQYSFIQKQLLMIEIYKISRAMIIELLFPCHKEGCEHQTEGYFNLSKNVIYTPIKEKKIKIMEYEFHISEDNFMVMDKFDDDTKIKYILGYVSKVTTNGKELAFDLDQLFDWVMNELSDKMYDDLMLFLNSNIPSISMINEVECEKCGSVNVYRHEGLPDFSLGLLE